MSQRMFTAIHKRIGGAAEAIKFCPVTDPMAVSKLLIELTEAVAFLAANCAPREAAPAKEEPESLSAAVARCRKEDDLEELKKQHRAMAAMILAVARLIHNEDNKRFDELLEEHGLLEDGGYIDWLHEASFQFREARK